MARDGAGNYSNPYPDFVAGTTIESAQIDANNADIAAALTASLAKDGQTVPTAHLPMNNFKHTGVGAASARTDYARADQVIGSVLDYAIDTGTATAYAIAPSPGISAYVVGQRFALKAINANSGADPTLAVNSLTAGIIYWPNGASLAAGDIPASAQVVVQVATVTTGTPTYHLQTVAKPTLARTGGTMTGALAMSGAAINEAQGADIASATTTDIGAATGNYVKVTGTTTITGLGTVQAGTERTVEFTGALTLTHNATSLILEGAANITTAAGDTAIFRSLGSGNWKCIRYTRAAYAPTGGQIVSTISSAVDTTSAAIPIDDTKPQSGEGKEVMTRAITPKSATSQLIIDVVVVGAVDTATAYFVASLFQDSGTDALATVVSNSPDANALNTISFRYVMTSGTTSATTFKVRVGPSSGTFTLNGNGGARLFGGAMASSIVIEERA